MILERLHAALAHSFPGRHWQNISCSMLFSLARVYAEGFWRLKDADCDTMDVGQIDHVDIDTRISAFGSLEAMFGEPLCANDASAVLSKYLVWVRIQHMIPNMACPATKGKYIAHHPSPEHRNPICAGVHRGVLLGSRQVAIHDRFDAQTICA